MIFVYIKNIIKPLSLCFSLLAITGCTAAEFAQFSEYYGRNMQSYGNSYTNNNNGCPFGYYRGISRQTGGYACMKLYPHYNNNSQSTNNTASSGCPSSSSAPDYSSSGSTSNAARSTDDNC